MRKKFLLLLACILYSGCATAVLPTPPDIFTLTEYPNAIKVGVPKVIDERGDLKVGSAQPVDRGEYVYFR